MTTEKTPDTNEPAPKGPMARRGVGLFTLVGRKLAPYVRVSLFVATLVALGSVYAIHRVEGQVGEQLVSMGELLMQYDDANYQDQTRVLSLNGQPLRFSSGDTQRPLSDVLDYFETVCASRDGGVLAHVETLRADHPSLESPVYRYDLPHEGVVACLDMGTEQMSIDMIRHRILRFNETQDLNDLGDIRYVYASQAEDGANTHFLAFWTDGTFRMDQVLPADGDAGGEDIPFVERPPGSRRTLSASEVGNPDIAVQYAGAPMTTWELEHFYHEALPRAGWQVIPADAVELGEDGNRVVLATRDGTDLYVSLIAEDDSHSQATIVQAR
jgi:hypothetical protein